MQIIYMLSLITEHTEVCFPPHKVLWILQLRSVQQPTGQTCLCCNFRTQRGASHHSILTCEKTHMQDREEAARLKVCNSLRLSPLSPPGSEGKAAPCQESAVRFLAHTGQAEGLCLRLAGVMLLQVHMAPPVSHRLKKSQKRRKGQQIKCLQGKQNYVQKQDETDVSLRFRQKCKSAEDIRTKCLNCLSRRCRDGCGYSRQRKIH
ncbi:PREDICTED: uncharacterized protein LOC108506843 isoform X1 [Lepidothrix coronata]|uniref:Uncharacterized protein LOC108506843 isoform X1 n=2 Tax=Lepidothrix coronata TaxID=321398 RepID=A0A6J0ISS2_9PASS|nr:PREDICTED: uncharacterized protein LOC108506843 isoform X1 [Lepidothrix coronata]XP_017689720.1 PREDICTED: uncharacterized protein LOC108506843 isoform X1 [Lepidothrix coronata]